MTTRTVCIALALALLATHVASAQEYPEGWEPISYLPASISGTWVDIADPAVNDPGDIRCDWDINNAYVYRTRTHQQWLFQNGFASKALPNGLKEYMAFVNEGDESIVIVRQSSQTIQLTTVDTDGKKQVFNLRRR